MKVRGIKYHARHFRIIALSAAFFSLVPLMAFGAGPQAESMPQSVAPIVEKPHKLCDKTFARFNFARVNEEQKSCFTGLRDKLSGFTNLLIVIDGHRDKAETQGISITRANSIRDYLVMEIGIDASLIQVRNFGDTCPADARNADKNRRVQVWLVTEMIDTRDGDELRLKMNSVKTCPAGAMIIKNESPAVAADAG